MRRALPIALLALLLAGDAVAQRRQVPWPQPVDLGIYAMELRAWEQQLSTVHFEVDYDFRFTDQRAASGISFQHRIVDDAAKDYKPVHYDHGSGIATADVDGDGLYDIYFVNQNGPNELWKSLGGGRFVNITAEAGVGMEGRIQVAASFADVDNDGDQDLYVTTVRTGNVLFRNDGKGRFEDVTAEAGLEYVGHSSGAVFFDYDRDGWIDLFLTNVGRYTTDDRGAGGYYIGYEDAFSGHLFSERTETSILYRNLGEGRFEDVSEATGLVDGSWSGDATLADVNGDGFQDLYVVNMQGDDHYWENVGGSRFEEKTAGSFAKTSWGAMGLKFMDFDNDGVQDLFVTDMHSDMSREVLPGYEKLKSLVTWSDEDYLQGGSDNIFGNSFYRGLGGGRFEEISDAIGAENYWPWGLSVGDLNADGWEDAFVCSSMNMPYRYGVNSVLLNNKGKTFLDSEFLLGVEPRPNDRHKKPWFDLDCDGADSEHHICQSLPEGKFTLLGNLGTRSSLIIDLDDDGDLDVVTNEFNDYPQVLVSDLAERRSIRWVKVKLVGTDSNRDGLGAVVRVEAGQSSWTRVHDGKSGYLSQSGSLPLYFGLGEAESIDRIVVTWPNGAEQTFDEDLTVNSLIELVEK